MGKCVMSGWLTKEGGRVKNWKRRYFTLDSRHMLRYYKSETDKKEAGHIDMTQCQKIICANRCRCEWHHTVDEKLAFGIVTPKRIYHIYGDRMDELQQWMLAFKKAARITAAIPVGNPIVEGTTKNALKQRAEAHEDRARRISMNLSSQMQPLPETPGRNTVSVVPTAPSSSSLQREAPLQKTARNEDEWKSDLEEGEVCSHQHQQQQQQQQQQHVTEANEPSHDSSSNTTSSNNSSSRSPQMTASERQQTRAKFLDVFNLEDEVGAEDASLGADTATASHTPHSRHNHDSEQQQQDERTNDRWGEGAEGVYDNLDYVGRVEEDYASGSEDGGDVEADADRLAFIDTMKEASQEAEASRHHQPQSNSSGGVAELSQQTKTLRLQSQTATTQQQSPSGGSGGGGYESSDFFSSDDEEDDGTAC